MSENSPNSMTRGFWRLLIDEPMDAASNMARDEALLMGDGPPTLRLYRWDPPALSLGYFQSVADVDRDILRENGMDVVRRLTGGGAIAHIDELTFCITAPEGVFPYDGTVESSYYRLHQAIISGLTGILDSASELKLDLQETRACSKGEVLGVRGSGRSLASDIPEKSFYCFYHSASPDIVFEERKLLGSAQRRRSERVLHHGSLPLKRNPITANAASLREVGVPSFEIAARAFVAGLEENLGLHFADGSLTESEVILVKELRRKYAGAEFLGRR